MFQLMRSALVVIVSTVRITVWVPTTMYVLSCFSRPPIAGRAAVLLRCLAALSHCVNTLHAVDKVRKGKLAALQFERRRLLTLLLELTSVMLVCILANAGDGLIPMLITPSSAFVIHAWVCVAEQYRAVDYLYVVLPWMVISFSLSLYGHCTGQSTCQGQRLLPALSSFTLLATVLPAFVLHMPTTSRFAPLRLFSRTHAR